MDALPHTHSTQKPRPIRVGSVSFLNAKPLIYGLASDAHLALSLAVPSRLLDGLVSGALDVALLPVIDYQRMEGLWVLTSGGIGCDGPTLTVRLFSPVPLDQTSVVACDIDSHTSVALARVIFAERFKLRPKFIDLDPRAVPADATRLLIGDKVVREEPNHLRHQLDLGEAWKQMTGEPFLFACWMARSGVNVGDLPERLREAKERGLAHIEEIIAEHAVPGGWPADVARRYFLKYLKFDVGPRQLEAVRLFHRLAFQYGALDRQPRPLRLLEASAGFNLTHVAK
jgi:chorismate dehydratase